MRAPKTKTVSFPPPDSTPSCEEPPMHAVNTATDAIRTILATIHDTAPDAWRDATGALHIMACELVARVCKLEIPASAAEWAIHKMMLDGQFTAYAAIGDRFARNCLRYMRGAFLKSTPKLLTTARIHKTKIPPDKRTKKRYRSPVCKHCQSVQTIVQSTRKDKRVIHCDNCGKNFHLVR
jgi:hypothetical protein